MISDIICKNQSIPAHHPETLIGFLKTPPCCSIISILSLIPIAIPLRIANNISESFILLFIPTIDAVISGSQNGVFSPLKYGKKRVSSLGLISKSGNFSNLRIFLAQSTEIPAVFIMPDIFQRPSIKCL